VVFVITIVVAVACVVLFFLIRRAIIRSGNQPSYLGFRRSRR